MAGAASNRRRVLIGLLACVILATTGTDAASAAKRPLLFEIDATYTYAWRGHLVVEEHVAGVGRKETEVWVPCGGTPPGLTLEWQPSVIPGAPPGEGFYRLVDSSGKTQFVCTGPPEILEPLPHSLSLLIGNGCNGPEERGDSVRLEPIVTVTPATAGTSTREEVRFEESRRYPASQMDQNASACLVESFSWKEANPECAKFFAPELCAQEYKGAHEVIQAVPMVFITSPTPNCPKARAAQHRLQQRIKALGPDWKAEPAKHRARRHLTRLYAQRVHPRFLGECN